MYKERLDLAGPVEFESEEEREACIVFFNAAFRAEESGLAQAHNLAEEVRSWDPPLAECLVLYGNEEGWHRQLLTRFLAHIGGEVRPMRRITSSFYRLYGQARRMETIMLTNLMFETIGSTTYRLALGRVKQPAVRAMLSVLTRDESFHVPLNVHFIREILKAKGPSLATRVKLRVIYHLLFMALLGSSVASRRVAGRFDHIGWKELSTAYAENLGRLFLNESDLRFSPPWALLRLFGLDRRRLLECNTDAISVKAAEAAARREDVEVTAADR